MGALALSVSQGGGSEYVVRQYHRVRTKGYAEQCNGSKPVTHQQNHAPATLAPCLSATFSNAMSPTTTPLQHLHPEVEHLFPWFANLPERLRRRFELEVTERRVPASARMFDRGSTCEGFPLVLDGTVRVSTRSASGREIVLYRVEPGESCLLSGSCLLSHVRYSASGVAETDVSMLRIPPSLFDALMVESNAFRAFVFDMYAQRLAEVMELIEEVAFRKLDTRLARLLVQQGPVIETSHQALADELGSVRVFVSRLLRNFELQGWIQLERERVTVIDPGALADFVKQS